MTNLSIFPNPYPQCELDDKSVNITDPSVLVKRDFQILQK